MNDEREIFPSVDPAKVRKYTEEKRTFGSSPAELSKAIAQKRDLVIVDVRTAEDFADGHIPGAVNLPPGQWESPSGLSKEKANVVYCYSHTCHFAEDASAIFSALGYQVIEMDGGYDFWRLSGFEVER